MSKKKGPFLITDLVSKIGVPPTSTRSTKSAENTDHARNAYGFIAENYKNTSCEPKAKPTVNQAAHEKLGSNQVQNGFRNRFKTGSNQVQKKSPQNHNFLNRVQNRVQLWFKTGSNQVQIRFKMTPLYLKHQPF